ncbi:MAG: cbb3-type cytochrome c oxidase subunit I [Gaiellales bacterium]
MVAHAPELTSTHDAHDHHGGGPQRSIWLRGSWVRAAWVTVLGCVIGFYGVEVVRSVLFGWPAYNQGVSDTFMLLLGGVGFTIGIGCWDYWWGYLSGQPDWVAEDHSQHGAYTWKDYFKVNTDHKVIGVQYLVTTFFFFLVAGALAEGVRAELATPGQQYFSPGTFNGLFSVHAALMIFLFVIPAFAGLGNFVIPIMLGAQDMAFPRQNALSFWMLPVAGMCMVSSFFVGAFDAGWTNYATVATHGPAGQTFWVMGVQFAGASSIATAVNFLVTIVTMRAPGMTFWRMPLLVWANLATSTLVVLGTPFVAGAQFQVLFDRLFPMHFFDPTAGGSVIVYQHIFWFYSHPAVYIMMLPGFGIISEILPVHARKPIFGYKLIAMSTVAIGVLGFTVWAHHMFVSGMSPWLRIPMMATTLLIAIPTGIKIFSWLATLWEGVLHLRTPMLFACGFLFTFVIGGLSGIFLAMLPVDINLSDTYFVVAHIHYVLFGGSVMTIYAGIYHWFPKMTGKMYDEALGKLHFWVTFVSFNLTFMPMHWLGLEGMSRRIADYPSKWADVNFFISLWAFVLGASTLIFIYNMAHSWWKGEPAPSNPWRALTLEWQVSSPPPVFNFDEPPQVVGSPYSYGVPGARHAIVTVAPPEPAMRPAPVVLATATREQREAMMSTLKHILVVANQTVGGERLIAAVKAHAEGEPSRVTVICPQNDPQDAWVVDESQVIAETQARLDATLAALRGAGIQATGRIVDRDPYTAVLDVVESSDPPAEIVISTLPQTRSGWLRRDLVQRLRDRTGLPVEHVVVDVEAGQAGVS